MEKTETEETMIQITMKGNGVITAFIPQDTVSLTLGWRALRQEFLVSRRSLPFTVILSATIPGKANAHFGDLSASPVVSFPGFTGRIVSGTRISTSFLEDQPSPRCRPIPFPTLLNTNHL